MSESLEQQTFINIIRAKYPLTHSIPNGGYRAKTTADTLKREGLLAGVCDLFIPELLLYVEMKAEKGMVSPKQKQFIADINEKTPCSAIVAWGYKDALKKIIDFE